MPKPFLQGFLPAAQGQHRGVVALAEAEFAQAGAGQGGTGRQQHFNRLLTTYLIAAQVEPGIVALGCELNRVVLLKTKQVLSGHPQQQVVAGLQLAVRQGGQQAFSGTLKFQYIHVETPLQTAVMQGDAHQFRVVGNGDFGAVAAALGRESQVVMVVATIRQQGPWCQHQIGRPHQPDRQADQRETEQLQ